MKKHIHIVSKVLVLGIIIFIVPLLISACKSNPVPMTQEEREYIDWYDEFNERVYDSNQMFKDALNTYADDPSNLEAQIVIARELVKLGNIYYEEVTEKKAPQSLSSIHDGLIGAMGEFKAASDALSSKEFEMFVTHIKNGDKQLLEINKTYREWRSMHY